MAEMGHESSTKEKASSPRDRQSKRRRNVNKSPTAIKNMSDEKTAKAHVISFESLYDAAMRCAKDVRWKDSVANYIDHALIKTLRLKQSFEDGTYSIGKYSVFYVYEPKKRRITSTKFKDRVFQRSLCDNYLYDEVTKCFIPENCACQKGKGTDYARALLVKMLKGFWGEHRLNGYVLQCDLSDFFGSTPHDTAKRAISERVEDEWAVNHVHAIIDSFDKGIGLGSEVSQLIQLAVLDDLDHFVKEGLGIRHYVRYMDDFILIGESKEELKDDLGKIRSLLEERGLRLSEKKTHIRKISQPTHFLGFSFLLWKSGKVTIKLCGENLKNERRRLKCLKRKCLEGKMSREQVDDCYTAWRAHAKKTDSRGAIMRMDRFYKDLWR